MRSSLLVVLAVLVLPFSHAGAEPLPYRGPHPSDMAGHFHLEESVHVHEALPVDGGTFANVDGVLVFLGDPVAYGYDGPVFAHVGAHPLPARMMAYCGISGRHRHPFPPEGTYRVLDDGALVFDGVMRGGLPMVRPERLVPRGEAAVRPSLAMPPVATAPGPDFYYAPHRHGHEHHGPGPAAPPPQRCTLLTGRAAILSGCPSIGPGVQARRPRRPVPRRRFVAPGLTAQSRPAPAPPEVPF